MTVTTSAAQPARRSAPWLGVPDVVGPWAQRARSCLSPCPDGGWLRRATGARSGTPSGPQTVAEVRSWLYQDGHLGVDVTDTDGAGIDAPEVAERLGVLVPGSWASPGWRTIRGVEGRWEVSKGAVRLLVGEDGLAAGSIDGGEVAVRLPRARPGALPGWFAVAGPNGPPASVDSRVYLHLRSLEDLHLGAVLDALEPLEPRWQAKFSTRPSGALRPDCAVVYVPSRDLPEVLARCAGTALAAALVDPVPGFSTRVAPGVGCSVDLPGLRGGSFGAGVADLLARDLVATGDLGGALEGRLTAALSGPAPREGDHDG